METITFKLQCVLFTKISKVLNNLRYNLFHNNRKYNTPFFMLVFFMLFFVAGNISYSQSIDTESSEHTNFGVDSGVYSGVMLFSTDTNNLIDDWFKGLTAFGVIDETVPFLNPKSPSLGGQLGDRNNDAIEIRMSHPVYSIVNNQLWVDAVFVRDQNTNGNFKDSNVFTGGSDKNIDNPSTWTVTKADVPQKNDIIDVFGHVRREGASVDTDEWIFLGASTRNANGDSHIDFEIFRGGLEIVNGQPISEGQESFGGRTPYLFDTTGAVTQSGDAILSVDYTNGGAQANTRIYIWLETEENQILGLKILTANP